MYFTTPVFRGSMKHRSSALMRNPQFDDFYHNFMPSLYQTAGIRRWANFGGSPRSFGSFFWAAFSIPFLAIPWLLGDRHIRVVLIQFALSRDRLWIVVFYHAHYAAPLQQLSMYC